MGDSTPAKTDSTSTSQPWSPATPLLQSLISKYGSFDTSLSPLQTSALGNINLAASGIPNLGGVGTEGVKKLFSTDTSPQVGMLGQGYDTLKANLGNTASGAELDPYKTPGFADALATMTGDITKATKGVYAGSGRAPSGAGSFAQSLGRGLTQGIAPTIASQFNTNNANRFNAANSLFSGAGTTAGGEAQLGQLPLTNILQGLQGAGMIPGLYTAPAAAQVSAANLTQSQPLTNMQGVLTPALGLGALGTQTTGTTTATPANNPLMNVLGGLGLGAGLLTSPLSGAGSASALGLMFSDERVKEGIEKVGELDDGQNVYTYRYKGDDTPRLGLIAQEVAEHVPEAVHNIGGVLAVDYAAATKRARGHKVGMLELREAA